MKSPKESAFDPSIQRFAVVGTSGSGKSTLASGIALRLHIPHVELDALHWLPGWSHVPEEELRCRVEAATRAPAWVIDGNYGTVRDIIWPRAQAVVWLDYPLALILGRLLRRTWLRIVRREFLWGTNYERTWEQFFSRDSILLWALKTYGKHKRTYPLLLASSDNAHLKVYRFKSPGEAGRWLDSLPCPRSGCK